jgi:adenylate cyclase
MADLAAQIVRSNLTSVDPFKLDHKLLTSQLAGTAFSSSLEPCQVSHAVTEQMVKLLDIEGCAIFEWNQAANTLIPLSCHHHNNGKVLMLAEFPLARNVLLQQKIRQVSSDQPDLTEAELGYMQQARVDNMLLLPMVHFDRVVGLAVMLHRDKYCITDQQIVLAQMLANQAISAIENARLYDEVHQRVDELTVLTTISQVITSTLDLQEMLTIITDLTTPLLNVAATSVVLYDETRSRLWYVAASGEGSACVREQHLIPGQGITGWVAQQGKPALVPDVSQDARFWNKFDQISGFNTTSMLCVPLQFKGQTIGAIAAMNKKSGLFDQTDLRLMSSMAAPAAIAIENARLYARAQREITERKQAEIDLQINKKFSRIYAQHLEALEILHEVGLHLMNNLDTDSVLTLISQAVLDLIPEAAGCILHLASNNGQQLLPVVFPANGSGKTIYPKLGIEKIIWQAIDTGKAINVPDIWTGACRPSLPEIQSLLVIPLVDNQIHPSLGTLGVYSPKPGLFLEEHQHILSILAGQAAVAITKARFFEEREVDQARAKQAIRNLFQRYVSPAVVERLVEGRENLALGGKRQEISVLFADIRGFSTFSEKLAPESLVEVLNQYLALAVEAILTQEGTLDKFMGDAVMAVFNAPLAQPDHVQRAVRAALTMQRTIANHNAAISSHQPLSFGIGVHVGEAVVGNIGTPQQMNYTAIGDTVNLAKRLQENAQGGQIILSQTAYEAVKDVAEVKELGKLPIKGRMEAAQTYLLIDLH